MSPRDSAPTITPAAGRTSVKRRNDGAGGPPSGGRARTLLASALVLHSLPDRARIRVRDWDGTDPGALENELLGRPGVRSVRANPLTRNVLVRFDPAVGIMEVLAGGPGPVPAARASGAGGSARASAPARPTAVARQQRLLHLVASAQGEADRARAAARLLHLVPPAQGESGPAPAARTPGGPARARRIAPFLPKILLLIVSIVTTQGAYGYLVAGLEAIQLLLQIHGRLVVA